jgi:serine/threonine protein kinase
MIKLADIGFPLRIADVSPTLEMISYTDPQFFKGLTNNNDKNYHYKANKKSDIYSIGVLLWKVSSGQIPFESYCDYFQLISEIQNGKRESPITNTPTDYIDVYTSMTLYYYYLINQAKHFFNFKILFRMLAK